MYKIFYRADNYYCKLCYQTFANRSFDNLKKNKANLIVNENKALHSLFFGFDWTFRQNLRQFLS